LCYCLCECISDNLALLVIDRTFSQRENDIPDNSYLNTLFLNLKNFSAEILLLFFKHQELIVYALNNFETDISSLFYRPSDATKKINLQF
jgi:hypothetical protein